MRSKAELLDEAHMLISRLERISADSTWARRSSGHRGALLKWVEAIEGMDRSQEPLEEASALETLEGLIRTGYDYLANAARERLR